MDLGLFAGVASIVWLDVVLSGDNALVIGIAASTLRPELRRKAILFGLGLATVIRILLAGAATYLLELPGLKIAGGLALLYVTWGLYRELRGHGEASAGEDGTVSTTASRQGESNSLFRALTAITVADISMSVDNVLAVASVAAGDVELLVFGLLLSIALMGLGATLLVKLLLRYRWISYGGVLLLLVISLQMLREGLGHLGALGRAIGLA
ncbi:MAG: YjbE family putative metal transport protein [Hyphomicrobiaceae bacterium]